MTFEEFINHISIEKFQEWYAQHQTPKSWNDYNYRKYALQKDDQAYPFRWMLYQLAEYYHIELEKQPFSSSHEEVSIFAEKFNLTILKMADYTAKDYEKLAALVTTFQYPHILEKWIQFSHEIVMDLNIPPAKIRMSIMNKKELVLVMGMRAVFAYHEKEGKPIVGFYVNRKEDYNHLGLEMNMVHPYKNKDKMDYVDAFITSWEDIPLEVLAETKNNIQTDYNRLKDVKKIRWENASTTSRSLKFWIFNNEKLDEFMKINKHIGLLAADKTNWKDDYINEINGSQYFTLWNSKRPSGTDDTISLLKETIKELGYFELIYFEGELAKYRAEIIGLAENDEDLKEWTNFYPEKEILYFNKNLTEYKDETKPAKMVFLSRNFHKLDPPIHKGEFSLHGGYDYPRQDNLTPFYMGTKRVRKMEQNKLSSIIQKNTPPLNQILYGPPGTGKTYHTINKAVAIIEGVKASALEGEREDIKARFKGYAEEGRIVFTTFHQSMTYEDFVEGIKPKTIEENGISKVTYEIKPGIFKNICEAAKKATLNPKEKSKASLFDKAFKMLKDSLAASENDEVVIPMRKVSFTITKITDKHIHFRKKSGGTGHDLVIGNVEQIFTGEKIYNEQGLGVYYNPLNDFLHNLVKGIPDDKDDIDLDEFSKKYDAFFLRLDKINEGKGLELMTKSKIAPFKLYQSNYGSLHAVVGNDSSAFFKKEEIYNVYFNGKSSNNDSYIYPIAEKILEKKDSKIKITNAHVLIIDEINRGNVSSIFGELITLIEEDKRIGNDEELRLTLPYSKDEEEKKFGVPSNLHIIGTMNTADRSVEALDTALRRRFVFEEMPPKPSVIKTKGKLKEKGGKIEIAGQQIDLVDLLQTINDRIEVLLDKDHLIGHSYFMKVASWKTLRKAFSKNIIPLLQEYFYGDFGKIALVLGLGFCKAKDSSSKGNKDIFAEIGNNDISENYTEKIIYEIQHPKTDKEILEAINLLLNKKPVQTTNDGK